MEDTEREKIRICAVCGYALESQLQVTGRVWMHLRPEEQHVAVPVRPEELSVVNVRCDFCDVQDAPFVVLCESFTMHDLKANSVSHWAACAECAALVRRGRWSQLITRVRTVGGKWARAAPRASLASAYEKVALHMQGVITVTEWKERGSHYS